MNGGKRDFLFKTVGFLSVFPVFHFLKSKLNPPNLIENQKQVWFLEAQLKLQIPTESISSMSCQKFIKTYYYDSKIRNLNTEFVNNNKLIYADYKTIDSRGIVAVKYFADEETLDSFVNRTINNPDHFKMKLVRLTKKPLSMDLFNKVRKNNFNQDFFLTNVETYPAKNAII